MNNKRQKVLLGVGTTLVSTGITLAVEKGMPLWGVLCMLVGAGCLVGYDDIASIDLSSELDIDFGDDSN